MLLKFVLRMKLPIAFDLLFYKIILWARRQVVQGSNNKKSEWFYTTNNSKMLQMFDAFIGLHQNGL